MPFTLTRESVADPVLLWSVVTDVTGHGRWVPLTTMVTDPGPPRVGWGFAGVTGLGPARFRDAMVVTVWEPPTALDPQGRMRLVKTGRPLRGWAEVTVAPRTPAPGARSGGSTVTWTEDLGPRGPGLSRALDPVSRRAGGLLFGRVLDGLVAEADARAGESGG